MNTIEGKELSKKIQEELSEIDVEVKYREFLQEVYGDVEVCGMMMSAARILEEMDPIAFRCGLNDWLDGEDNITEVNGGYYDTDEVNEIKEEFEAAQEEGKPDEEN